MILLIYNLNGLSDIPDPFLGKIIQIILENQSFILVMNNFEIYVYCLRLHQTLDEWQIVVFGLDQLRLLILTLTEIPVVRHLSGVVALSEKETPHLIKKEALANITLQ